MWSLSDHNSDGFISVWCTYTWNFDRWTCLFHMQVHAIQQMKMSISAFSLDSFEVTISNHSFPVTRNDFVDTAKFAPCGQYSGYPAARAWGQVTCSPGPVRGRFVFISSPHKSVILTICELKVFAGMLFSNESNITSSTILRSFIIQFWKFTQQITHETVCV